MERARRRNDAQLLIEDNQGLANGGDDAVEISAGSLDFSLRSFDLGNAGKRDNNPVDAAPVPAIGQHPSHEPTTVVSFDFAPDGRMACQHRACIRKKILVLEPAFQADKRPTGITRDELEEQLCGWREEAEVQVGIKKKRRHVRADEDILKVLERRALLLDCPVQLAIVGRELRIVGAQLLLRSQFAGSHWFRQGALVRLRPRPAGLCTAS